MAANTDRCTHPAAAAFEKTAGCSRNGRETSHPRARPSCLSWEIGSTFSTFEGFFPPLNVAYAFFREPHQPSVFFPKEDFSRFFLPDRLGFPEDLGGGSHQESLRGVTISGDSLQI